MQLLALLFLIVSARGQALPEIRGTVTEFGTNAPLAGAEVTLTEYVKEDGVQVERLAAKVVTDSRGGFVFRGQVAGPYAVAASKEGYAPVDEVTGDGQFWHSTWPFVIASESSPQQRLSLMRPGSLTGRVVDENDKPVPNFSVSTKGASVATNEDGIFLFEGLVPTPHLIRAGLDEDGPTLLEYAQEQYDVVTTYWPGGATDPTQAVPIDILPGGTANAGTIRLRKVRYYQARIEYFGECGVDPAQWLLKFDEAWTLNIVLDCTKEFTLARLLPGSHTLAMWTGSAAEGHEIERWALIPFTIAQENVDVSFHFTDVTDVPVRIVHASGGRQPSLESAQVTLDAILSSPRQRQANPKAGDSFWAATSSDGVFTIPSVAWPRHEVIMSLVDSGLAVKEIRYNRQLVSDGTITLVPGAPLEVFVDDKPASVFGTTAPRARVLLVKWPLIGIEGAPYQYEAWSDTNGHYRIDSLAAGEYRVIATQGAVEEPKLKRLWPSATKVSLQRGELREIELKLSDLPR